MTGFGAFGSGSAFGGGSSTFGSSAFGGNNSSTSAFGKPATSNPFATNSSTTSGFGSGATGSSGFGSGATGSTGFGTSSPFGAKPSTPAFGSSTNPFGNAASNTSTMFGGGGGTNNNTTSSAFGAPSSGFGTTQANSSSAFGSSPFGTTKPAFGSSTSAFGSTNPSPFGTNTQSTNTQSPFGTANTSAFGSNSNNTTTTFGGNTLVITSNPFGTGNIVNKGTVELVNFQPSGRKENGSHSTSTDYYQAIVANDPYDRFSLEELRFVDYNQGRKYANNSGQAGVFGQSNGFGQANNPFGAPKPALSVFGQPAPNVSQPGLGAFGALNAAAPANNPFGSLGTTPAAPSNNPFGLGNFANNQSTNPFGQPQAPQNNNPFGAFGQPTQQQQQVQAQNQLSNGGLFGNKPTPFPTLIGNSNLAPAANIFGQPVLQPSAATMFDPKPAITNPFGIQQSQANSLFPHGQQQVPTVTGVFQAPGTGIGLLPQSQIAPFQAQQTAGSVFGTTLNPQGQQQQTILLQPQPTILVATLDDNPWGKSQLFSSLMSNSQNLGPIATPSLSATTRAKKPEIVPQHRLVPNAASRLITPQKRPNGYGFSYSTYNSPSNSVYNNSPSASRTAINLARSLGRSHSTTNLRKSYSSALEDSIISPTAFGSLPRAASGGMKKLNVNRALTNTLPLWHPQEPTSNFTPHASPLSKQVSFDLTVKDAANGSNDSTDSGLLSPSSPSSPWMSGALIRIESNESDASDAFTPPAHDNREEPGFTVNGSAPPRPSEKSSSRSHAHQLANRERRAQQEEQIPGDYTTTPSLDELCRLKNTAPEQLTCIKNFTVAREGVGSIIFSQVDLTDVPLDRIIDDIVRLEIRSATVYSDESIEETKKPSTVYTNDLSASGKNPAIRKPSVGQGLNVRSIISLENSWPLRRLKRRQTPDRNGTVLASHINRLKKVPDTQYIHYDPNEGIWTFQVEHYTTYELLYGEDDEEDRSAVEGMVVDQVADFAPQQQLPTSTRQNPVKPPVPSATYFLHHSDKSSSTDSSSLDDTFDFKTNKHTISIPGQFSEIELPDDDPMDEGEPEPSTPQFASPDQARQADQMQAEDDDTFVDSVNASGRPHLGHDMQKMEEPYFRTPSKLDPLVLDNDWAGQLQRTVSPRKQDRHLLRQKQTEASSAKSSERKPLKTVAFDTSLDIMKSLFQPHLEKKLFVPVNVTAVVSPRLYRNEDMESKSLLSRGLKYVDSSSSFDRLSSVIAEIAGGSRISPSINLKSTRSIRYQEENTVVGFTQNSTMPKAALSRGFHFSNFTETVQPSTTEGIQEYNMWRLAAFLFEESTDSLPSNFQHEEDSEYKLLLHRKQFSQFWKNLVQPEVQERFSAATSHEERAFIHLVGYNVEAACQSLVDGSNYHLASIVAQIGVGDEEFRNTMEQQLRDWLDLNVASEMNDYIRAIYELLAGNTLQVRGKPADGVEKKLSAFKISTRFNLSWKLAFGLRLWYGIYPHEHFASAINLFVQHLELGQEPAVPLPWFILQGVNTGWKDPHPQSRRDSMYLLLKMYDQLAIETAAATRQDDYADSTTDFLSLFSPENLSGNPNNPRLSFELLDAFSSAYMNFPTILWAQIRQAHDSVVLGYAALLDRHIDDSQDETLLYCFWLVMHVSKEQSRITLIKALLEHYAKHLVKSEELVDTLTKGKLLIPFSWIVSAKAAYARNVAKDAVMEARFLIEARDYIGAHRLIVSRIGPQSVIENDFTGLRETLRRLANPDIASLDKRHDATVTAAAVAASDHSAPIAITSSVHRSSSYYQYKPPAAAGRYRSGHRSNRAPYTLSGYAGWDCGAGMYEVYMRLLQLVPDVKRKQASRAKTKTIRLFNRLCTALQQLAARNSQDDRRSTLEKVAVKLMTLKVLEMGRQRGRFSPKQTLQFPLEQGERLHQARLLSLRTLGVHRRIDDTKEREERERILRYRNMRFG